MNVHQLTFDVLPLKKGVELGLKDKHKYQFTLCPDCGKYTWKCLNKGRPFSIYCRHCSAVRRETNKSLEVKRKAGFAHRKALQKRMQGRIYGEGNPHWKGGVIVRSDGYIQVWVSPNDFFHPMATKDNYVMEHRLVMAKHLARCLLPWEIVHHKGTKYPQGSKEDKSDNRLENLQLLSDIKHNAISTVQAYVKRLENKLQFSHTKHRGMGGTNNPTIHSSENVRRLCAKCHSGLDGIREV